jgi:hypothetical protein
MPGMTDEEWAAFCERDKRAAEEIIDPILRAHYDRLERSLRAKSVAPDWDRWDRELADDLERGMRRIARDEAGDVDAGQRRRLETHAQEVARDCHAQLRMHMGEFYDLDLDEALAYARDEVPYTSSGLSIKAMVG